ncbi:dTDP-4-amino-4,6-dideoxygalactose transaminase [Thalassovita litoralis]|uniref:dTDP-4-amino-4,6-dideoxygalactose transaminase n=1 Tax=Thalassovita litoralis TaxID=1010611 RepID=A0A521D316_9RHOB|nr:DegT/DnrJ/EryC1/StrS family aminotransferase [Thalassovita litoralis]SMO66095.1 dTDP-4-amino-4,6-dideoxygalactose transaminase [Thalassovita litoralis]
MTAKKTHLRVPFADLHRQYLSIKPEIDAAISKTIETSAFIRGPEVDAFENAFAKAIGPDHCVSCANGTDAIYIAMKMLGVRPNDQVIVPAMSWISTSETVSQAGADVVFCDIDPVTNTLDPAKLEACITERTVGIIPVHLYGHPADMGRIIEIADKNSLWVIEDCAQAHLSEFKGSKVGTFGIAATFSFYPGKNLGAMGDAGAIVTKSRDLAEGMAKFARHGGLRKGDHEIEGINSRLDGLQAAILNVKLPHLEDWTAKRAELAEKYTQKLAHLDALTCPTTAEDARHVWHLYVVRTKDRDGLAEHLKAHNVQTSINYPKALPFLPCYARLGHRPEDFPNAYALQNEGLALPIFPEMTDAELDHVCTSIEKFFRA